MAFTFNALPFRQQWKPTWQSSVEHKPNASIPTYDLKLVQKLSFHFTGMFLCFEFFKMNYSWMNYISNLRGFLNPSVFKIYLKIVILFSKLHWQCLTLLHVISLVAYWLVSGSLIAVILPLLLWLLPVDKSIELIALTTSPWCQQISVDYIHSLCEKIHKRPPVNKLMIYSSLVL